MLRWLKWPVTGDSSSIGHYKITRKLGAGGMGVVYAALDERLGRPVAVKVISDSSRDERARDRLRREAQAAARVNHPNICQVHEIGEQAGEPYIVMELLEGESLAEGAPPLARSRGALRRGTRPAPPCRGPARPGQPRCRRPRGRGGEGAVRAAGRPARCAPRRGAAAGHRDRPRGLSSRPQAIPSRLWISSRGTPFVSGMTFSTHRSCSAIIAA